MKALLQSLWGRLWPKLAPVWPVLLLLAAAAALAALGLNDAVWLDRLVQPGWVVWPGLLCGLLLARTRWPGWFNALYSLLLSTAVALQAIAQPLPALAQMRGLSFLEALLLIDQRLEVLVQRLGGWLQLARQGLPNFDSGLPLLVLLVLGWNLLAWLACFTRRGRPFIGLLPAWLLLATVGYSSGQNLWLLAYFTLVSVLLLAASHYRGRIAQWEHCKVDFPDGLSFEWTAAAATLALGLMLLARAAPLAFSPQGWQQVRNWLEPPAEENPVTAQTGAQTGPSLLPAASIDLSTIGAHLPTGDETVLWVGTNEAPPPPPQSGLAAAAGQSARHYWRGGIMAVYTGRGWLAAALDLRGKDPLRSQPPTLARHYALEQTIEIPGTPGAMAFAANQPFEAAGVGLYAIIPDGSLMVAGMSGYYRVISWVPRVDAAALRGADPQHIPPDLLAAYTQLPASLPQRVRDLAGRITQGQTTAYDQAVAVQDYLRVTYPYDLNVAPAAAGADVVDDFLFDTRAGFCSHFASAMAVLLRAQGVPARVAVGYLNGDYDFGRGMYRVPASAAHAWVEVYFAGYGWIEFEPTPAFQAPRYNRANQTASSEVTPSQSSPVIFNIRQVLLGAGILAGAGVLVLLAAIVRFQRGARGSRNPAGRLYWRLRSVLAWGGCSAPANVTPLEFLGSCQPALGAYPRLQETAGLLTGLYLRDRFTPAGVGAGELTAARARWRSARVELGKWLLERWWGKFTPKVFTTEPQRSQRRN